ncbi:MAG TPA: type 4 pilus major pilin [Trinickia sp.]
MKPDRRLVKPAALPRSTPRARHRQRGASLLEGIAYLGIAAIVVIGAIALLRTAFGSANANTMLEQLSSLQTATRKLYMTTQGNYGTGSLNGPLIAAGAVPQGMSVSASGSTVTNSWGGDVAVTGASTSFTIDYKNVPQDVCVDALTGTTTSWTSVVIGTGSSLPTPVSPAAAQTACATGSNEITWTSN